MVLRHPGGVVAQAVGGLDLGGDARVDRAVRVGLGDVIGVRREQDAEFHEAILRSGLSERELASSLAETVLPGTRPLVYVPWTQRPRSGPNRPAVEYPKGGERHGRSGTSQGSHVPDEPPLFPEDAR